MVSNNTTNKVLLLGALLIAGSGLVSAFPADNDEQMMNDNYADYEDDPIVPNPVEVPSGIGKTDIPLVNRTQTKVGVLGEDIMLSCHENITSSNVILWMQDNKIITSGNSVLLPNFSLDPKSYNLTILKASPQSAGTYYCQILPEKVFISTELVLNNHSLDVITPESSKSGQDCLHRLALFSLLPVALLLQQLSH